MLRFLVSAADEMQHSLALLWASAMIVRQQLNYRTSLMTGKLMEAKRLRAGRLGGGRRGAQLMTGLVLLPPRSLMTNKSI